MCHPALFLRLRRFQPNHWRPDTLGDKPDSPGRRNALRKTPLSNPKCLYARSNFSWCNSGSLFTMTGLESISSISCK